MEIKKIKERYPLLQEVVENIEKEDKIKELYEPQEKVIKEGILNEGNFILAMPTASGKTLIAELVAMKEILNNGKVIYLTPLKALANEKYEEMKKKYGKIAKIGISTSDFDSSGEELSKFNFLILTVEKMDSLMRHKATWINEISLVIVDEVHLLNSMDRGPTLEIVMTKLKENARIIALSATIENAEEIASWLRAKLISSNFRPITLYKGIFLEDRIIFDKKDDLIIGKEKSGYSKIVILTIEKGGQCLIFVNTKQRAEREAEKISEEISKFLLTKELKELKKVSNEILNAIETPTKQCKRLAKCISNGVAFHHAGLNLKQRSIVERNFKNNIIKVVCATPTLAWGVNLPAKRVIVRDYKRYGTFGMEPIPVLEIHQMFGRAGRPKYDKDGEAILIANSLKEFEKLWDLYIEGRPELILSKLGVEPTLRMHLLGEIAEANKSKEDLYNFFEKTFYSFQFSDIERIKGIIDKILDQLYFWKFIDYKERFFCTKLGIRVAQLYIDPLTAHELIEKFEHKLDEIEILTLISDTIEMRPLPSVKSIEEDEIYSKFINTKVECDVRVFKNALVLLDWINEKTEDEIYDKYGMPPGTIRTKVSIAEWLLYAGEELLKVLNKNKESIKFSLLKKRMKYGVKLELLPLVSLKGIGRVRARKLYNAGFTSREKILNARIEELKKVVGKKVAENLIKELNEFN